MGKLTWENLLIHTALFKVHAMVHMCSPQLAWQKIANFSILVGFFRLMMYREDWINMLFPTPSRTRRIHGTSYIYLHLPNKNQQKSWIGKHIRTIVPWDPSGIPWYFPTFFEAQALLPKSCFLDLAAWAESWWEGKPPHLKRNILWWWKKSCTTEDVWNPVSNGINCHLPNQLVQDFFHQQYHFVFFWKPFWIIGW